MAGSCISRHFRNIGDLFSGSAEQFHRFVHAEINQIIIKKCTGFLLEKLSQIGGIYVEAAAEFLDGNTFRVVFLYIADSSLYNRA